MEQTQNRDWGAIALVGLSALAILIFLAGGIIALAGGIADWQKTHDTTLSLLPAFLLIAAFLLVAAVMVRLVWLALRRIQNKPSETARFKPLSFWLAITLFGGWILAIVVAVTLLRQPILQWFSLPFYLLAISLPVYGLVRLATSGLELGSQLRAWGTLSAGMTVAPLLSALAEGMIAFLLLVVIGIFIGLDPQRMESVQKLMEQLKHITTQEEVINLLGPILSNPLTLVGGLFFLSFVTPLVEETAKSLPVWMAWRKIESPAQGFALGALSGAGFGLVEGLFISANPGVTWGVTMAVRAASSAMHMITAGIIGWGIGLATKHKRLLPALGRYALGIAFHGLWNACIVLMVFASGRTLLSTTNATPDIAAALIVIGVFCFLGLLILSAPIGLWVLNHQMRKSTLATAVMENAEIPPTENMVR